MEEGDYRFVVNVRAEGAGEVLASALMPVKLDAQAAAKPVFFLSNFRTVAGNAGLSSYFRGLEAMAQRQNERAAEYLEQAVGASAQPNPMASGALVQLHFEARKYERVAALYGRLGAAAFQSAESLAQVALSYWNTGDSGAARRVLDSALAMFPDNKLLPVVAKRIEQPARKD
jgi:tetratricopeptide (TPR) repeat protein